METRRPRADNGAADVRASRDPDWNNDTRVERYVEDFDEEFDVIEGNAILPTGLHLCYPLWVEDLEEVA